MNIGQRILLFLLQNARKVPAKCLLDMLAEILQLVHEINSLPGVFYKKGFVKSSSKFRSKHKIESSGGVLPGRCS